MKKINKDPFSNGTENMTFEDYNCSNCIKFSVYNEKTGTFTNADKNNLPKCSIRRDIVVRAFTNIPISGLTIKVCEDFTLRGITCPCMKTK